MEYFRKAIPFEDASEVNEFHERYEKFINYLRSHNLYDEFFGHLTRYYESGDSFYSSGFDGGVTDTPTEQHYSWEICYKDKVIDSDSGWYTDYSGGFSKGGRGAKNYTEQSLYDYLRDKTKREHEIIDFLEKCLKALNVSLKEYYGIKKEEPSKFKEVKEEHNEEVKEEKNSKKEAIKEFLERIKELLDNHGIKEEDMYGSVVVDESVLITTVEDHREIRPEFLPFIKFIDLSKISCKNLKVSGLDLRNTNIKLNPNQVYNKDLSNTLLSTSALSKMFDGCNFEGCIISDSVEPSELTESNGKKR